MSSSDPAARRSEDPDGTAVDAGHAPSRPVVTLAAYYGAGGHVVGPRMAERLGVELLDRGILRAVAEQMRLLSDYDYLSVRYYGTGGVDEIVRRAD